MTSDNSDNNVYESQSSYISHLQTKAKLPAGFSVGATRFTFSPLEVQDKILPMNLTLIVANQPTSSFAALFTSNLYPGGPVIVGKDRLHRSSTLQAIIVNNKISNVCPGGVTDRGAGDSESICQAVASALGLPSKDLVFPSSTGIIGWRLPVEAIKAAIPAAAAQLQSSSILPAALGITTTDRYPKLRSYVSKDGSWRIVGTTKGAGMIEPNMATMLAYILTDLDVPRSQLQSSLALATKDSFNAISVDGDQSTSDTVLALSSQVVQSDAAALAEFQFGLSEVCKGLAADIVRNGEGTQHVIRVKVTGALTDLVARDLGRFVVNSNLVKCAISGSDPNVGRIVGAIGSFLGSAAVSATQEEKETLTRDMVVALGGEVIFEKNAFQLDPSKERRLSDYMLDAQLFPADLPEHDRNYPPHSKYVDIEIRLSGSASGQCTVIGSDLTKEYVEVNADYRS